MVCLVVFVGQVGAKGVVVVLSTVSDCLSCFSFVGSG